MRELTLKETNTATLQMRLRHLVRQDIREDKARVLAEIEAIERELEERNEGDRKVSRW